MLHVGARIPGPARRVRKSVGEAGYNITHIGHLPSGTFRRSGTGLRQLEYARCPGHPTFLPHLLGRPILGSRVPAFRQDRFRGGA